MVQTRSCHGHYMSLCQKTGGKYSFLNQRRDNRASIKIKDEIQKRLQAVTNTNSPLG